MVAQHPADGPNGLGEKVEAEESAEGEEDKVEQVVAFALLVGLVHALHGALEGKLGLFHGLLLRSCRRVPRDQQKRMKKVARREGGESKGTKRGGGVEERAVGRAGTDSRGCWREGSRRGGGGEE